ncbi:TetR/AcrR family transcriptional regulator [Corynebacterium timonense]|uniref:DNA-binding transcriptional regulator, AcrR family n=1 Tax=Corynebacterium timonense TaxID=441500 RepID=A0A1H1V726_9CORY|nr:TetR/AcrR family transcriptional regulator [Corynebacterium timonense]SDS80548.1 DNA-binding transcriptional regulator, AcrR family [Corynebacterium timonense]
MNDFSLDHQFSESAAAIADATIRIIASRGLDAVSVREVAKESGFAAGSVQYHAPNKDTLLAHAFIRSIQRQGERVMAVPERGGRLETWVARLAELLPIGGVRSEDAAIWVTYGSASATRVWIAKLYTEVLEDFQNRIVLALGGEEREEEAKRKARLVTALVNGLALDNLRVSEAEADRILADLREGLRLLFAG